MVINLVIILQFTAIAIAAALPAVGIAISQGLASTGAAVMINQQPAARGAISRIFFISLALVEGAAVLSILIAFLLLMQTAATHTLPQAYANLGTAFAIALPTTLIGILSGYPVRATLESLARQPLVSQPMMNLLIFTLLIVQTSVILGFVVGILIMQQSGGNLSMANGLRLCACGLTLGLGSLGPSCGMILFGIETCRGVGINRSAYNKLFSLALLGQAMIGAPIIFAMVTSLMLFFIPIDQHAPTIAGFVCLAAALSTGLINGVVGFGSGRTARAACIGIAKDPELYGAISRTLIIGQTLIDSNAIFGLLSALLVILSLRG